MATTGEYTVIVRIGDIEEVRTITHAATVLMMAVAEWRATLPAHRTWTSAEIGLERTFREQLDLLGPLLDISPGQQH